MKSQAKVKFIILLSIMVMVALFVIIGFQLFKIGKVKKQISAQQYQIQQLQKELDYYNNIPNGPHNSITGEN